MEEVLVEFIKWSLIELACNSELDNRGYNLNKEKPSNLKDALKRNDNNFERAISQVARVLSLDENFKKLVDDYDQLLEHNEEKDEACMDLFVFVVENVGIYQILSLHMDSMDKFVLKFSSLFG
jgi:hypothetical protein